jgi:hypothetical protein
MPDLGVILPCRNSAAFLPRHVQCLQQWSDLAARIVVVDSASTDGGVEYLRAHLRHPDIAFLQHPPGLYQSWNFGLRQLQTKYALIATVGDTLTRAGVLHLLEFAEALGSDVLISKPAFMADDTHSAADIRWPVDDLIQTLAIARPRALSWLEVLLFTAVHLDGTLLGSSASNLYRADILQRFPFPADFGKAGDAAWAARHFADVRWAVTPEKFSTFLRHPDSPPASERQSWKTSIRLDKVLLDAVEAAAAAGLIPRAALETHGLPALLDAATHWLDAKQAFDQVRAGAWPWILNPAAWLARSRRNLHRRHCLQLRDAALALRESNAEN